MRAGVIAPRDERRLRRRDLAQRVDDVLVAGDVRRIGLRTDDDEVVVHDVEALHALPFGHEFVFGVPVVHENHVGIAPPSDVERLAGPHGDDLHADTLRFRELRKQVVEQARLLGGRRRRDRDGALLGLGGAEPTQHGEDDCDGSHRCVPPDGIRTDAPLREIHWTLITLHFLREKRSTMRLLDRNTWKRRARQFGVPALC